MPNCSSKRQETDPNRLAFLTVQKVIEQSESQAANGLDPLAVELGRRGGLKAGKARAEKRSARRRREIAKKAATARWKSARSS